MPGRVISAFLCSMFNSCVSWVEWCRNVRLSFKLLETIRGFFKWLNAEN